MKLYEFMARRNWPRTYSGKILLVSFIGVHVPMIGAVTWVLLGDTTPFTEQLDVLAAMLVATLLGTAGTMFVMRALLAPVHAATRAADGYLRERKTPRLPTRYGDGAGVLMASVQECITRLDNALTAEELQRQRIEQDHAAKFRMLAGMKHDFRTPLTHILGFAELMKSETIGPLGGDAYRKYAATIGKSGRDLLQTLQSVLDLSDAQTRGQLAEDSDDVDLTALAQQAVSLEHLLAEKRGVRVTLSAPDTLTVRTEPKIAKNLFGALLQAGIAGSPQDGQVRLRVSGTPEAPQLELRSVAGRLSLEDVPAEMIDQIGAIRSGTGSAAASPETSTPMTLRISLIDTLCRAVGAQLRLEQTEAPGFVLRVTLASTQVPVAALAAE